MKKVLILSPHGWPPKNNAQILRLVSLTKHLPEHGWEPIVVARGIKTYDTKDFELAREVEGIKCYFYRGILPSRSRIIQFLNWFFIPDVFLIDLMVNFWKILKIIYKERPDVIFASTPPSGFIIAYLLSKKYGIPLVLDYADPWTTSGFYTAPTALHRGFDQKIEKLILKHSSRIVGASDVLLKDILITFKVQKEWIWVPNGFNEKMFNIKNKKNKKTTFLYAGSVYRQFDLAFIKIFRDIYLNSDLKDDFELCFVGHIAPSRLKYIKKNGKGFTKIFGRVSTERYFSYLMSSDVLIFYRDMRLDKDFMTSRLPEYIYTEKPIMAFVNKDTLIGDIVKNAGTGFIFERGKEGRAKEFIIKAIEGKIEVKPNMKYIMQFEWGNIAKKLVEVLEDVSNE